MKPNGLTQQERLRSLRSFLESSSQSEPGEVKAEINVTPLVDVVLVLLIIFMVVTPLIASGVAVDLPRTRHHAMKPDDGKDIVVSVTADEKLFMGSKQLERPEELALQVAREKLRTPGKDVYLKADTRVDFGTVRRTLDALHEADVSNIILGTEAAEEERKP